MRLYNVNSTIKINTILARLAPSQSGKMGYSVDGKDITIFAIEKCDHCGKEVQGANPITIVGARQFVIDALARNKVAHRPYIVDEIGCTDNGDAVCSECYGKQEKAG